MKLWVMSDLHQEFPDLAWKPWRVPDHDLLVLAGDIHGGARNTIAYAESLTDQPIVLVAGNHEFYGRNIEAELAELRALSAASGRIAFLEDSQIAIGGVRFLGATLWADFTLFGRERAAACAATCAKEMNDFRLIRTKDETPGERIFSPEDCARRHAESRARLALGLAQTFDGPTVVVTHHAPHPGSLDARFRRDPVSAAFVTDLTETIMAGAPDLWIHGHVHDCFDYRVGRTRVLCNPRGYEGELRRFDEALVVAL